MNAPIREIEVVGDKTIRELVDELCLSYVPMLLEVNGEVFYPDEIMDTRLRKGDKVKLIPLIAGG